MAHYAFIKDNIVTEVIVGKDEDDTTDLPEGYTSWEDWYLTHRPGQDACKRTSYNTIFNTHTDGGTPFRGSFASKGYTYDEANDVFYPPADFPSWTLDENWEWQPPTPRPSDENAYKWDEETTSWVQIS
tara:strand:+ start:206 stop:592 length:387 start_codon:yes stop_codon:yes gene_type:complete